MKKDISVNVQFSTNQILKLLIILSFCFLAIKLHRVIILLFFSFILMASTKPAAVFLHKKLKIPEAVSISIVYISVLLILFFVVYFVSKPFAAELNRLSENAPMILEDLVKRFPFLSDKVSGKSVSDITRNLFSNVSREVSSVGQAASNALDFTLGAFHAIIEVISTIIISIYLFLDRDKILRFFIAVFKLDEDKFFSAYDKIETQLGAWVRGQLLLGFIVGLATWVGLTILRVKFALPLAVLAGIFEIIPIIGPILSAIPVTVFGFSVNPLTGLLSLGLAVLIQQLENHILVPTVMKRAVGLSPVVTLVSILIGSTLLGIAGSIIAVPMAAMISVLLGIYLEEKDISI